MQALMRKHGMTNWGPVAANLGNGRTADDCKRHWHDVLAPKLRKARLSKAALVWTEEEERQMQALMREHGMNNWAAVAARLPGRDEQTCKRHWFDVLAPKLRADALKRREVQKMGGAAPAAAPRAITNAAADNAAAAAVGLGGAKAPLAKADSFGDDFDSDGSDMSTDYDSETDNT